MMFDHESESDLSMTLALFFLESDLSITLALFFFFSSSYCCLLLLLFVGGVSFLFRSLSVVGRAGDGRARCITLCRRYSIL